MVRRDYYLDKIIRNMWNGEVKVITGIRRCGKSVLLFELFYDYQPYCILGRKCYSYFLKNGAKYMNSYCKNGALYCITS